MDKEAIDTMNINFFGTLDLCNALFPLLRNNARVVNVSSRLGLLSEISNKEIRNKFLSENLNTSDIIQIVNEYIE
jgi:carbonyl reductase 1